MRIGFYIHHSMMKAGGIYTYSIGILRLLLKAEGIKSLVIITTPEIRKNLSEFLVNPKVEVKTINRKSIFVNIRIIISIVFHDIGIVYGRFNSENRIITFLKSFSVKINPYNSLIKKSRIQLLHVPMQYSPIYLTSVPVITTMHDLQEFHFPENFSSEERIHRTINNHKSIYSSDRIIVSFDHIKNDILKFYNVSPTKIAVCPPPFTENWFVVKSETNFAFLREKYGLSGKFLLYPAATWKHKNHITLLETLKDILPEFENMELVCTGNKTEYFETIQKKISELKIANRVKFLGIVPEEDLIGLYKNCQLVVIPTIYEAGSGPLYEAMKYNAPVICADTTSLPMAINHSDYVFNPTDVQQLGSLIKRMLIDKTFRHQNIMNSEKRIRELSSIDYFSKFHDIYSEISNKY